MSDPFLLPYSYLYIGGVAQSESAVVKTNKRFISADIGVRFPAAPGAPPQNGGSAFSTATGATEKIESAIWYFNTRDRKITLGWVNPDGCQ